MKSKICPVCNTANNPSFIACYHCSQSFDPAVIVNPGAAKREAYDAFKLSRFSNLFARENLKVFLCLLPWTLASGALNYLSLKMAPNIKGLQLIILLGPATLILGWCIKHLLPKYSDREWEISDNIFIAGLKVHLYALLPAFLVALKLLVVYLPILLLFKFMPPARVLDGIFSVSAVRIPGVMLLVIIQSILYDLVYVLAVRFLYEKKIG